jgi:hypothetical protein
MIRLIIFNAILLGSCGYALLRGTRDAKIVAIVTLVASFATLLLFRTYSEVETGVLVVDTLTFLAFTAVAIKSDRFWPLWISGLQLTTTFGHLLKAFEDQLVPIAYAVALRSWSYPIQIILAVAVWRSQRRARAEERTVPVR